MKSKIKVLSFSEELVSKGIIGKFRLGILLAFVKEGYPDEIKSKQKKSSRNLTLLAETTRKSSGDGGRSGRLYAGPKGTKMSRI